METNRGDTDKLLAQTGDGGQWLTRITGCDMIDNVRKVPLHSLAPGDRFELVLNATTPYPHKRIPGTVVRQGPGTVAVVLDHAENERSFTTREGQLVVMRVTGGIQYWAPSCPVLRLPEKRDKEWLNRWTTQGGTGVGPSPEAEAENQFNEEKRRNDMAERVAALPIGGQTQTKTDKEKAKRAKGPQAVKAPKQPKPLNNCLCGCGEQVSGRFRQGHDGRYYSILRKVVASEMAFNEMPRLMQHMTQNMAGVKKALAQHG